MKIQIPRIKKHFLQIILGSFLLASSFWAAGLAQSPDDSKLLDIMKRIKEARKELTYVGMFEVRRGGDQPHDMTFKIWVQPPSIFHMEPQFLKSGSRQRRPPREEPSGRWMPRRRQPFHESGHEFVVFPRKKYLSLFRQNYKADLQDAEPVAGRSAALLSMIPNHLPRFGMKLWYDKSNFVVLKREIVYFETEREEISFRQEFKEIEFVDTLPDSIEQIAKKRRTDWRRHKPESEGKYQTVEELVNKRDVEVFVPAYVPKGCELAAIDFNAENGRKIIHLHYTDGLLGFSIFEVTGPPPKSIKRLLQRRHMSRRHNHEFQQIFVDRKDRHSFLLLGNFPREELKKTADSLEAKDRNSSF